MLHCLRHRRVETGWTGFFRSTLLSSGKSFAHYGIMFATYNELAKAFVPPRPIGQQPTLANAVLTWSSGAVAGLAATIVTHPMDVARTRYTIAPFVGTTAVYTNELMVLPKILAQEGLYSGLYRGLSYSLVGGLGQLVVD